MLAAAAKARTGLPAPVAGLKPELEKAKKLGDEVRDTANAISEATQKHDTGYFLRQIWMRWMAHLRTSSIGGVGRYRGPDLLRNADVLNRKPISDHLHEIGVLGERSELGVDLGGFHPFDDAEGRAVRAAQHRVLVGRVGRLTRMGHQTYVVIGADPDSSSTGEADQAAFVPVTSSLAPGTLVRLERHKGAWKPVAVG